MIAGVSVALVLIPQSLAYAELAGMPPYFGLYAAMLPPIAAAFFASSPYLQTGPVAMTSLLTFGALAVLAPPQSPEYIALAALLAVVVGVVRTFLGGIRAGWVAYMMSQPVLTGFTAAAAILIVASQLPTALGVQAEGERLLARAWWALGHVSSWELASVVLSLLTISLVLAGRRLHALFPGVLVAVGLGIGYSLIAGYGGPVVGQVPSGLPPFSLDLPWTALPSLAIPGVVIALVGFAEPAAISRIFAAQDRRPWSPDREFVSQGVANLAAGFSGAFPVGGSFSRSSVNRLAGGKTRWSGAVTGLVVLAFLPVAGVLAPLPRAILGAIVISAVVKLIAVGRLGRLIHYSLPQALIAWFTFAATLLLAPRIELAVLMGIGLAILVHLWRELAVHVATEYSDETLRLTPHGVLFFASAPGLDEAVIQQLAAHPSAERLVIDLAQLGRIDYTGALALKDVVEEAELASLHVEMTGIPPHARRILTKVFGADSPLLK
ncbi:MAG: SulP family inorganic anion transporter [Gemmatimonadales bacterium]|nr:SulP family inorganic anion transporter [Gemmatimonadales bacterium]